jgi:hypothetical protein
MATAVTISRAAVSPHSAPTPTRGSLLRRALARLIEARQRQADREIGEILRRRGGVMAEDGAFPLTRRPERLYRQSG